jgi:hypothetical protein
MQCRCGQTDSNSVFHTVFITIYDFETKVTVNVAKNFAPNLKLFDVLQTSKISGTVYTYSDVLYIRVGRFLTKI